MKKIFYVLRHELVTALGRPSYLLITFGIPMLGLLIFTIVTIFRNQPTQSSVDDPGASDSFEMDIEGYIDPAGLVKVIPPDLPPDHLIPYLDEKSAQGALDAGEIEAFYIIPQDYIETGDLIYVKPDYTPFTEDSQDWVMRWALLYNITGGDIDRASHIWHPMNTTTRDLNVELSATASGSGECITPGAECDYSLLMRSLPMIMLVMFYMFIAAGAGLMLNNVSKEKQNRTMETLMLSVHPRQMLSGKIIGLGLVALLQMMVWIGSVFILLRLGGSILNLPPGFTIPTSLLVWALIFFVLGYVIYSSLMAGLGAMVPDVKAATQASMIVLLPLLIGYFLSVLPPVQEAPHGGLATFISIFPLTAPPVMMMRLIIGNVPIWQPLLAVLLMVLAVIVIIRAVAGMFHTQNILTGQPFNIKLYLNALLGRA